MRYFRSAILSAIFTVMLVVPATAGAQITSLSVTGGELQARGAAVSLQVGVQCDPGWNVTSVNASVTQVVRGRLTQGFGSFPLTFSGVPCPLSAAFTVIASGPFPFKQGSATARVDVGVVNPTTEQFFGQTVTQTLDLTKK